MPSRVGKVIVPPDVNVWPHEMETARALARSGLTVEFIRRREGQHVRSADVLIDGEEWEMKAPASSRLKMVEQNLRRALKQSSNIILDTRRMKRIPDKAVERELRKWARELKSLKKLMMVSRHGKVIAIK